MARKKTIHDIEVAGRRVLMRVDFNVPMKDRQVTDDRRIVMALESIRSVIDRGGRLILMSHLGRPKGAPDPALSLKPVAGRLATHLKRPVAFADDCIGTDADFAALGLHDGEVLLLENLRFHAAETLIDQVRKSGNKEPTKEQSETIASFAEYLSRHGEIYCNDAFGTCHREHVSMYDVPKRIHPGPCVVGALVERELRFLGEALHAPERPFIAILGGAKVSDKIGVIEAMIPKVNAILIGGAMAYTFLAAEGQKIGASRYEQDKIDTAKHLLKFADGKLRLPTDHVCAPSLTDGSQSKVCEGAIDDGLMGLDIGPATREAYARCISDAKTIVWNGPMGVFETKPFDAGTIAVARAMADATGRGATTIIGGGDSAAAVESAGLAAAMTHISTGGGASLEFLEGRDFATINVLDNA